MSARRILLVEDNPDDEALTLRALKKSNILNEVTVARDGAEAVACLFEGDRTDTARPALVLLDLKLPKVDGFEVLRRIRADERTRLIPVVILTSSGQEEDILEGYLGGANAYVRKPVAFAGFAEAVRALGMFWLLVNEPPVDALSPPQASDAPTLTATP
jgi:two-component system response regulator